MKNNLFYNIFFSTLTAESPRFPTTTRILPRFCFKIESSLVWIKVSPSWAKEVVKGILILPGIQPLLKLKNNRSLKKLKLNCRLELIKKNVNEWVHYFSYSSWFLTSTTIIFCFWNFDRFKSSSSRKSSPLMRAHFSDFRSAKGIASVFYLKWK